MQVPSYQTAINHTQSQLPNHFNSYRTNPAFNPTDFDPLFYEKVWSPLNISTKSTDFSYMSSQANAEQYSTEKATHYSLMSPRAIKKSPNTLTQTGK